MSASRNTLVLLLCALGPSLGTSACALTSKAELVPVRYFSPESQMKRPEHPDGGAAVRVALTAPPLELRLGRVSSGANLRERIVYRDAAYELGYYEELRWTERPEAYVRRALGRSLFEQHGLHRVLTGSAPTLDIEVVAFDDIRLTTGRSARVQLRGVLYDDDGALFEDTLTVERPVASGTGAIEDMVAAMAAALDAATEQLTAKVESALMARRAAVTPKKVGVPGP
jgi:cholesterol transport system auxiliary component